MRTIKEGEIGKKLCERAISFETLKQGNASQTSSDLMFIFHCVLSFFSIFIYPYCLFFYLLYISFFHRFNFFWRGDRLGRVRNQYSYFFAARSDFQIQYWVILRESWQADRREWKVCDQPVCKRISILVSVVLKCIHSRFLTVLGGILLLKYAQRIHVYIK